MADELRSRHWIGAVDGLECSVEITETEPGQFDNFAHEPFTLPDGSVMLPVGRVYYDLWQAITADDPDIRMTGDLTLAGVENVRVVKEGDTMTTTEDYSSYEDDVNNVHWLTQYEPDDGDPYGVICRCEIRNDHDGNGSLTDD